MNEQIATPSTAGEAAELAQRFELRRIGVRPKLGAYVRSLWARRQFIWALATASAYLRNRNSYLGQLWNVLTPMLWAAIYFLVFGVLIGTRDDAQNFIGFLVIGVFIFRFMTSTFTSGSRAINSNLSLVRSLHFPRAVLPIANVLADVIVLLPAIVVMAVIVASGGIWYEGVHDTPTWSWLLVPPALLVTWLFCTGAAMIIARLVADVRDLAHLLPFINRMLFYLSGVFFSVQARFGDVLGGALLPYAEHQPLAVYLYLFRSSMLGEFPVDGTMWLLGVGWAVLFAVGGFLFFWRAEERYGRD